MAVSLRSNAILLGLLGVADIVFIPTMTIGEPKAPMVAVVLTAMIGIASIVAAFALMKGIRWARPLGITSRLFDAISTIPVFFVGVPTAELVGAVIVMLLSILSAYLLIRLAPAKAA
jgi:hypothetical protein